MFVRISIITFTKQGKAYYLPFHREGCHGITTPPLLRYTGAATPFSSDSITLDTLSEDDNEREYAIYLEPHAT